MRTTLDLPEDLVREAREVTGLGSKTETIVYALKEVVRRHRIEALKAMFGTIDIAIDLDKTRGRRQALAK